LVLLAALFLVPMSFIVHGSYQRMKESRDMAGLIKVGIELFQAVRNFGYERGRTNVVLNHGGPLAEMASNREFVRQRRREGEQALTKALDALAGSRLAGLEKALADLRSVRKKVSALREKAEAEMAQPKAGRDPRLRAVWFATMSEMILNVRDLLEVLCRKVADLDGRAAVIAQLMLASIDMRDQCAPEMSLLSGVMLSGQPIQEEMRLRIIEKRGRSRQLWVIMRAWGTERVSVQVAQVVDRFGRLYFDKYLPLGREVLKASLTGGPYRLSQKYFLATGVAAIEALVKVMSAIVETGTQWADQMSGQAQRAFYISMTILLVGILLIVTVSVMAISRIINPLAELTLITRRIAKRDLDREVPYLSRRDEIGSVARAVDVLKGNTRQMIADNDALQETNAALEKALAEVRTLSGLLPICANCKKIRDDQGYWRQLETYIGEHSDAQFSHAICPDCVRKLYPDIADEVLKKPVVEPGPEKK
jgi:HAMP domain-containing protein